jgi:Na+-driven multidrug efflux pump
MDGAPVREKAEISSGAPAANGAAGRPSVRLVLTLAGPVWVHQMLLRSVILSDSLLAGDTRIPLLFTLAGFFGVQLPLAYFLALPAVDLGPLGVWPDFGLGLIGAWQAMFWDIILRGGALFYRFANGRWQRVRV